MKSAAILPAALICAQFALAQVPYERLRNADQEAGSWLTYSGAYHGQRFSKLDQINTENVADLRPVWVYQVEGSGEIETTPLVADGVMYVTELEARVTALDVRTGRPLWTYQHAMPEGVLNIGFGRTNRGGALLDETFYSEPSMRTSSLSTRSPARCAGRRRSPRTSWVTRSRPLRWRLTARSSLGSAAAKRAFEDFSTPTTRRPASAPGEPYHPRTRRTGQ